MSARPRGVNCCGLIDLEDELGGVWKMSAGRCVASVLSITSLANELFSKLGAEVRARGAGQVIEPVAVLQRPRAASRTRS